MQPYERADNAEDRYQLQNVDQNLAKVFHGQGATVHLSFAGARNHPKQVLYRARVEGKQVGLETKRLPAYHRKYILSIG